MASRTLPGTTAPASLLPPFLANDGGEAAIATGAARQTWPVGRGEAPSDACAILLHGRGVGGYVDVMNMAHSLVDQQLVPSDHILSTGSPLTGVPPPATRQDIERLVDTAVMNGCRKVYIYISSHGFASTSSDMGGVALSTPEQPDGSVADDPVRWDELMELFEPLSGKELCVIVDACFSGEGCEWFQGRGSTGVFVSAADSDHPSYSRDRVRGVSDGGAYTTALIGCWEDDSADSNGDGTVTLAEASLCVEQSFSDDFYIASPQPKTTSIQPNGPRNFGLLGAAHPRAGETFQIMIRRPMDLPLDVTFLGTLTIADPSVVSFTNGGATHQFRLFPGELTYEVDVMGHEEGGSDYSIGGLNLRDNIAYDGTATILVGLSYFATPNPVEINLLGGVNPVTVTLVRRGPIAYIGRDVTVLLFHFDSVIAKPRVDEIEFKPGDENMEFLVDGLSLGMMTISIIDSLYGLRVDLPVMVVNGTACALPGTAVPVTFTVQADPGGHHPSVGLGSADLTFTSQPNSQARIQSNDSQVVTATGGFDASTCTISVAGGMGTIAGFPGVRCEYRNIVISSSGNKATRVEGEYACGVGGELPGGQPIVYRFSGTAP